MADDELLKAVRNYQRTGLEACRSYIIKLAASRNMTLQQALHITCGSDCPVVQPKQTP